ncbi:hypothetical protein EMCRGX_G017206 [Ephydatia muelleri]
MGFVLQDDTSPLIIASQNGHLEIVKSLIEAGANVNHTAKDGITALDIAVIKGHSEIIEVLKSSQSKLCAATYQAEQTKVGKMAPGKQCLICERKTVDVTKPNGLSCTNCGLYFHSECSSTFSKVSLDVLSVVKKVCTPCPSCETYPKNLLLRVSNLEQMFVAKTVAVIGGSLPAQFGVVCNTGVDVDKAVKEAISAHDEKLCIILSGIKETGSAVTDKALVKEIFDSLSEDSFFSN